MRVIIVFAGIMKDWQGFWAPGVTRVSRAARVTRGT